MERLQNESLYLHTEFKVGVIDVSTYLYQSNIGVTFNSSCHKVIEELLNPTEAIIRFIWLRLCVPMELKYTKTPADTTKNVIQKS